MLFWHVRLSTTGYLRKRVGMWTTSTPLNTKKDPTQGWESQSSKLVEPVRFERTSIPVPPCGFRRDVEPVTAPRQKVQSVSTSASSRSSVAVRSRPSVIQSGWSAGAHTQAVDST